MLLAIEENEAPSVEQVLAFPLPQLIPANDCGYDGSRKELIANCIYPFPSRPNQRLQSRIIKTDVKQ